MGGMISCIKVTDKGLLLFWCVCHMDCVWVVVVICYYLNINIFKFMLLMINKELIFFLSLIEGQGFIYSFNKYLPSTN